jgi:scyllo-inositol 2-dehydrogenase (NADP+)
LQLGLGPCRRLWAWLAPAPWEGVDSGGHGRIALEFGDVLFQVETSRVSRLDRPRWWVIGTGGGLVKTGIDPQEDALRAGDIDRADEPAEHRALLRTGSTAAGDLREAVVPTVRSHWDSYYGNIAEHLLGRAPLAVTAEQAREVVRVLDAAGRSAAEHRPVEGPWGEPLPSLARMGG